MARLKSITIENYRSIKDAVTINFPENMPVILIGENNSGKSNIIRAIDIMFGEYHPKYKDFDDHDYFGRNPDDGTTIRINVEVKDFKNRIGKNNVECIGFLFEKSKHQEPKYLAIDCYKEENKYIKNELREELSAVWISSEQNLTYQLSYSSKYTLLSKVTKAFHE
ncbi:MAG: AAA family ATPase, partial [Patescibacteria group bacterium]|nr:AAA family ATPase [Patescibacteria group bacterium]